MKSHAQSRRCTQGQLEEKPFDGFGRIPEIRVQSKNMLVSDHFIIVARKNGECKTKENLL